MNHLPEAGLVVSALKMPIFFFSFAKCRHWNCVCARLCECGVGSLLGYFYCWGKGVHLVCAVEQLCIAVNSQCSPRCKQAGRVPQCARTQRTLKEKSLGKRPGHGSFQGTSYCYYLYQGITMECENILSPKCQGMKRVMVGFIRQAIQ